jgi:hypothetical protein
MLTSLQGDMPVTKGKRERERERERARERKTYLDMDPPLGHRHISLQ